MSWNSTFPKQSGSNQPLMEETFLYEDFLYRLCCPLSENVVVWYVWLSLSSPWSDMYKYDTVCGKLVFDFKLPLNNKDDSYLLHFDGSLWCETCFTSASSGSNLLPPSLGSYSFSDSYKSSSTLAILPSSITVLLSVQKIYCGCSNRHLWQFFTLIFRSSQRPGHGSHPCWMSWKNLDKDNLLQPSSASTRESENCWPGLWLPWIICCNSGYS